MQEEQERQREDFTDELRYHGQIQPRTWNLYKGHHWSFLSQGWICTKVLKSNLGHNECPLILERVSTAFMWGSTVP